MSTVTVPAIRLLGMPGAMRLPVASLLVRAADVLHERGWHRGALYRAVPGRPPADCALCAIGALVVAGGLADPAVATDLRMDGGPQETVSWAIDALAAVVADQVRAAGLVLADGVKPELNILALWNDELAAGVREIRISLLVAARAAETAVTR